ncbi:MULTISPECIES: DUF2516 family protein [Glycomyces]|jgi:hypothetical protein|uniref:DUF2516 family protein n=2 Tax=Glycomyces TaxID=58113 RepID=A0A9X3PLT7_9ACTN|nr:DUF2516 family protein [Glycomyces lechevalierae]MDA1386156.1 DUF2516 family protein [Glycomyces lechevalierae]MDR7338370.1 putative membrane protein [Glycomyces lechevalierae]
MPEFTAVAFAFEVRFFVYLVITLGAALLSVIALTHCAVQKPDAFSAVGTLSKGAWLGILAITLLLSLLLSVRGGFMFTLIALAAALVYLLDVRTGFKDLRGGGSSY